MPIAVEELVTFLIMVSVACTQDEKVVPFVLRTAIPLKSVIVELLGHQFLVKAYFIAELLDLLALMYESLL